MGDSYPLHQKHCVMLDSSAMAALIESLEGNRVLCVGDAMVDRYVYGTVKRVSPEAPIPVLHIDRETSMLGGAGNVVRNLSALGARPVLVSARGNDSAGEELAVLLARHKGGEAHLVTEPGRQTPVKTRFIAQAQQLLRVDRETVTPLSRVGRQTLMAQAAAALERVAAIVLSDYGKGVLMEGVAAELIAAARGRPVLVDPKGTDYGRYRGATLLTPNRCELAEATCLPVSNDAEVVVAARRLIETCAVEAVLVTRSQDGMTLVSADGMVYHLLAEAREVFDVSGAGDTVVATLAAALASSVRLEEAVRLANIAAGIVVGKVGTAVASAAEVVTALHHRELLSSETKVVSLETALERVTKWRQYGVTVGFTNGCFDLLHPGHVSLLRQARAACDRLIVGLNSDASVRRLKGSKRPVQSEAARAVVLTSLADVDLVVLFSSDTPLALIEAIRPDVLVKGADYAMESVVGASLVQGYGGMVLIAGLETGCSTTATIARMDLNASGQMVEV